MRHRSGYIADLKTGYRTLLSVFLIGLLSIPATDLFSSEIKTPEKINIYSFDHYSLEDGLPSNQIQCIYQDRRGWIWIGTSHGLSRFDGNRFKNYIHDPEDTSSLSGDLIRVIFEDNSGSLFIGTENGGLNIFDREKERFRHPFKNTPEFRGKDISVNAITADENGELYMGTNRSLIKYSPEGNPEIVTPLPADSSTYFNDCFIRALEFDDNGKLWIGATEGLFLYDPSSSKVETISVCTENNLSKEIMALYKDPDGSIWTGTYSCGLSIIDPGTRSSRKLPLESSYERTNTIRSISRGPLGDYWIGTRGGMFLYSKTNGITGFFRHDARDPKSLANNSVLDIFHDINGETWIGTRGGLDFLAKSKQVFRRFTAMPGDNRFLNSSIVYAFHADEKGRIWIGTEDGGINIYDPAKGSFEYIMSRENDPASISENCIKAFLDDNKGNMWIGTFLGGIDVLNLQTGEISHFRNIAGENGTLSDNRVWSLCMDNQGNIWVGTSAGIDLFDPVTNSFKHYNDFAGNTQVNWIKTDSEGDIWIGTLDKIVIYNHSSGKIIRYDERTRDFHEDIDGRYWLATLNKGLAEYSKTNGLIRYVTEKDGLSNNQTLCILEDNNKHLWISTSNGLSDYDVRNGHFTNFSTRDGIVNDQFSYGAALKTKNGELLFGGISGFNVFNPLEIKTEEYKAPIVFTELRIFNKPVKVSDDKNSILTKSISETDHLVLSYFQNVFTLEFTALDYINSSRNLYSYFLEGFDKDWNAAGTSRTATYTNLYPDDYILHVRSASEGNMLSSEELKLKISIIPPYWMTWWFRAIIISMILGLVYLLVRFIINREKIKNELNLEKTKARTLHELDMLKLKMFTNISHEIRTPLTLILGPLEKLISKNVPEEEVQSHLNLVFRNTKQLNRLIDQLLDFRKLETGNLKLEIVRDDMAILVSEVVQSFLEYAREKHITLEFHSHRKKLVSFFDPGKIRTILNNLLSNAVKFTPAGGLISVNLSLVLAENDNDSLTGGQEEHLIEISVRDTGKGISEINKEKIFTRFFRVDSGNESAGTGIGLALVKELVLLHKGTIEVSGSPGKGSKFTVRLPYDPEEGKLSETLHTDPCPGSKAGQEARNDAHIMLIVEDNPDVRYFIRSHFEHTYIIYEAKNGKEGFDIAAEVIPDIIISDILMPDIDGYELCKKIKKDERTSHIPLLLLTALHSKDHEIEGLSYGADDYITKPFDINVLQTKIENILQIRRLLKDKYTSQIILKPSDLTITSPDERFLRKAIEVVEKNISNADFDIEQFAREAGVSRMQLYRKFDALTNMTVKEFVRSIRLKRAEQLLLEKKMTITEIAYAVGFRDLSHFRKCFHREFGMSASEYVSSHSANDIN